MQEKGKESQSTELSQAQAPEFRDFVREYGLSKGEERQIYHTVDKRRKNDISTDWNEFYGIFVVAFKGCDTDGSHYLDQSEFEKCFSRPEWDVFRAQAEGGEIETPLDMVDIISRGKKKINFADYLVLRRSQVAWESCADKLGLSKLRFNCAVQIALPYDNNYDPLEMDQLFETAILINRGRLENFLFLDVPAFVDFVHIFTYFHDFDTSLSDGVLSKVEFIRGVQNQILPVALNTRHVDTMYEIIDQEAMSASTFVCVWDTFEMLMANDVDGNGFLDPEEFYKLISHKNIDKVLLSHIDGMYLPSEAEIIEESKKSTKKTVSEKSFILNFLQFSSLKTNRRAFKSLKSSKSSRKKEDFAQISDEEKQRRNLVYTIFDSMEKERMTLGDLLLFRKLAWNFVGYTYIQKFMNGHQLREASASFNHPIPYTVKEKTAFNDIVLFLSNYLILNIKIFFNFFAAPRMFEKYRIPGSQNNVAEDALKNVFGHEHIKYTETTISEAREFFRAGRERVQYNYLIAINRALFYECNVLRSKRLFELKIK